MLIPTAAPGPRSSTPRCSTPLAACTRRGCGSISSRACQLARRAAAGGCTAGEAMRVAAASVRHSQLRWQCLHRAPLEGGGHQLSQPATARIIMEAAVPVLLQLDGGQFQRRADDAQVLAEARE